MYQARLVLACSLGLAAALLVSACSDDNDSAAEVFVRGYCDLLMPCCRQAGLNSDPSDCTALLGAFTIGARYNGSKGDACLAAMRAASSDPDFCSLDDDVIDDQGACDDVFESGSGNVQPGGACESDSECASSPNGEGNCFYFWDGDSTVGVCMFEADGQQGSSPCVATRDGNVTIYASTDAPPKLGYVCDLADGVYCSDKSRTCTALKAIGEACTYSDRCVDQAYCDESGECAPKLALGATCTSTWGDECADEAYCQESSMTCTAKVVDGLPCGSSHECQSGMCNNDVCENTTDFALSLVCGG